MTGAHLELQLRDDVLQGLHSSVLVFAVAAGSRGMGGTDKVRGKMCVMGRARGLGSAGQSACAPLEGRLQRIAHADRPA